jgi:hypothetical protein
VASLRGVLGLQAAILPGSSGSGPRSPSERVECSRRASRGRPERALPEAI